MTEEEKATKAEMIKGVLEICEINLKLKELTYISAYMCAMLARISPYERQCYVNSLQKAVDEMNKEDGYTQ